MPAAVKDLRRIDRGVALGVAVHVQTQRQDGPAVLEGKQHALATLLSENLAVAGQVAGHDPGGNRNPRNVFQVGSDGCWQSVRAAKIQGITVHTPRSRHRLLCPHYQLGLLRGLADDGRVAAVLVERPVRQQRRIDRGLIRASRFRRARLLFRLAGPARDGHQENEDRHKVPHAMPLRRTHGLALQLNWGLRDYTI